MVDPVSGTSVGRATVRAITVAENRDEAIRTTRNGLLWSDDIEDLGVKPSRVTEFRLQSRSVEEFNNAVRLMIDTFGARFIVPHHRLNADLAVVFMNLLML